MRDPNSLRVKVVTSVGRALGIGCYFIGTVEDEAAYEDSTQTIMEVPRELVPSIRELIAKHKRPRRPNPPFEPMASFRGK
jgi:hypothetical protein